MARDIAKEIRGNKGGVIPFCLQVQRTLEGPWWILSNYFERLLHLQTAALSSPWSMSHSLGGNDLGALGQFTGIQ